MASSGSGMRRRFSSKRQNAKTGIIRLWYQTRRRKGRANRWGDLPPRPPGPLNGYSLRHFRRHAHSDRVPVWTNVTIRGVSEPQSRELSGANLARRFAEDVRMSADDGRSPPWMRPSWRSHTESGRLAQRRSASPEGFLRKVSQAEPTNKHTRRGTAVKNKFASCSPRS